MQRPHETDAFTTLPIVYFALAAGVALFALIVMVVVGPLESAYRSSGYRVVWLVVAAAATLGAGVAKGRLGRRRAPGVSASTALIVWGLAEGQALFGLTAYLLTGDTLIAVLALVLFAYLFIRYPPRSFRDRSRGSPAGHGD